MSQSPSRVLVLGLDGFDFDVIDPLLRDGKLPNLTALRESGAWAKMRSDVPPISSCAWTSICTGVNPGKHGIMGFAWPKPGTYGHGIIHSGLVRAPQIWNILARRSKRSVVLNVPHLYPVVPVSGVMTTGLLTPDEKSEWCYPSSVQSELVAAGLGFRRRPGVHQLQRMSSARAIKALNVHARRQADIARHLFSHHPWDMGFVVFDTPDTACHAFLGLAHAKARGDDIFQTTPGNIIAEHFAELDRIVGELLEIVPGDTAALVISDHGFCAIKKLVHLNQWLADEGFLRRQRRLLPGATTASWRARHVAELLTHLHLGFIARALPESVRQRKINVPRLGHLFSAQAPLWSATQAVVDATAACGGIRVNLRGREPEGIVSPGAEYEALREDLIVRLVAMRDPETGEAVVRGAWKREEVHPGEHNEHEPDIIIDFCDHYRAVATYKRRWIERTAPRQGAYHSSHGVMIAAGPGIEPQGELDAVSLRDVAPSVLSLLGVGVPEEIEGSVLPCIAGAPH